MTKNKRKKISFKGEITYFLDHITILFMMIYSWFFEGAILIRNLKSDIKKYNINVLDLLYNFFIKYPFLGFRPSCFFIYHFYQDSNKKYKNYIRCIDLIKIAKVNKYNPEILNNKLEFYLYLKNRSITPGLIAHYSPRTDIITNYSKPKGEKIILKPTYGHSGFGVKSVKSDQYEKILRRMSKDYIAENYIEQHPELNEIFPESVNTIRIITINNNNEYIPIKAMLRVGQIPGICVDNNSQGGITIGIDMNKKILLNGITLYKFGHNSFITHPITNYNFYGKTIPFFKEALKLAIDTHKILSMYALIGWDIAITKDGPVIIEGNRIPDLITIQAHYPIKKLLYPAIIKNI